MLFALFIYAVGFESGPQFLRSLERESIREIVMAAALAISWLATVVILARIFGLDKGLAAGTAAGGLTQSSIIGTASAATSKLGLAVEEVQRLRGNVTVGHAVTYIFGFLDAIIVRVNILRWLMGRRSIRDDAIKAEAEQLAGIRVYGHGHGGEFHAAFRKQGGKAERRKGGKAERRKGGKAERRKGGQGCRAKKRRQAQK